MDILTYLKYVAFNVILFILAVTAVAPLIKKVIDKGRQWNQQQWQWQQQQIQRENYYRSRVTNGQFIPFQEFERQWIITNNRGYGPPMGYKYSDCSGCYVITIYNHPVMDENYLSYENIYIGQSVHIHQRVHNHFNGKGNGDIYADIKRGKNVYVRFLPCSKNEMNSLEKQLIDVFHATSSYNKTRGGSASR